MLVSTVEMFNDGCHAPCLCTNTKLVINSRFERNPTISLRHPLPIDNKNKKKVEETNKLKNLKKFLVIHDLSNSTIIGQLSLPMKYKVQFS
jgi:hypothetical protein